MHACQSGPEQRGSRTHGGPFGPHLGLLAAEKLKEAFFWKKMCYYVSWYLQPSDVLACSLLWDSEARRARRWSVWNNSCWLLFLNFLCFVERFKAIPDWGLSRLLLEVGTMSFSVYWIAAWGNNSDGIWCHNPSGSFTWRLETPQSRFHRRDQQWRDENL